MKRSTVVGVVLAVAVCAYAGGLWNAHHFSGAASAVPDPNTLPGKCVSDGVVIAELNEAPGDDTRILTALNPMLIRKFAVKVTKPSLQIDYIVELTEEGKLPKTLASLRTTGLDDPNFKPGISKLILIMAPVSKDNASPAASLDTSDRLKVAFIGAGASSTQVIDNPYKGRSLFVSGNSNSDQKSLPLMGSTPRGGDPLDSFRPSDPRFARQQVSLRVESKPFAWPSPTSPDHR